MDVLHEKRNGSQHRVKFEADMQITRTMREAYKAANFGCLSQIIVLDEDFDQALRTVC